MKTRSPRSPLRGSLQLARDAAGAVLAMARDRLDEKLGSALPITPEALARPEVVNALLARHAPPHRDAFAPVDRVRLPGIDFESSNCRNFLIELQCDAAESGVQAPPRTMYVKLPCEERITRVFGNAIGFWPLECLFCERVAHQVPIRVPEVFAVARHGARFVLLLENLAEIPGIRLFLNRDMAAGTTVECAERCLSAFAELHAGFHGWDASRRDALLPLSTHTYLSERRSRTTRALNAMAIRPAHRAAPDLFTMDLVAACEQAVTRWDAMRAAWYSGPLALVHGDSHLGNCFEYPTPDGIRVGMLDFQAVHWSKGIRDVQYFLINSLEPEVLARHEAMLIEHYVAESERFGVPLELAETRALYRAFAFQTLMTSVVPLGLGSLTERDETVRTILRRSVAAAHRLDVPGWIGSL